MGIPKFFRWLSERYPLCSQLIEKDYIPEFDNLYLDMNGIIHNCTHGNSDDVHFRLTQEQMFSAIFKYIQDIFTRIQPKKIFFMAVDGVAPRAKINQQRSRRFKTAQAAHEAIQEALAKGEVLPETDPFDSNCITPGTEFMAALQQALEYFIAKKVSEDENWQNVQIILSGVDVPGEGEHKIMQYIRVARSQPNYDPNTRHCLYGLDADLIMLGLVSHDPHFCLLREEVVFGSKKNQQKKKSVSADSTTFYLLHLSIMREYLELEFEDLKQSLTFEFDLERVIDDFVLMSIFVGNDFLPHLPGLHIHEGALALMFDYYKRVLPQLDGYMNEDGYIRFDRLEKMLLLLAKREEDSFKEEFLELNQDKVDKKSRKRPSSITKKQLELLSQVKKYTSNSSSGRLNFPKDLPAEDVQFLFLLSKELGFVAEMIGTSAQDQFLSISHMPILHEKSKRESEETETDDDDDDDEDEEEEAYLARLRIFKIYENLPVVNGSPVKYEIPVEKKVEAAFKSQKATYYKEKMEIDFENQEQMDQHLGFYLQGLQWVMNYYYHGVKSWGWFFPYHYSPMISDLVPEVEKKFKKMNPFTLGTPFKPFEQLMGVLPTLSQALLPVPYRDLMTNPNSPIIDFYPMTFESDLNGKKNDWEAVARIPFVDEIRLQKALKSKESLLKPHEKKRNLFGTSWLFQYSKKVEKFESEQEEMPSFEGTFSKIPYDLPTLKADQTYSHRLLDGVFLKENLLPGFPSMWTLPFDKSLDNHQIQVFTYPSKNPSFALRVFVKDSPSNLLAYPNKEADWAKQYLGKNVYIQWPFLREAKVVSIENENFKYELDPLGQLQTLHSNQKPFLNKVEQVKKYYSKKRGILINEQMFPLVHCLLLKNMEKCRDGSVRKRYEGHPIAIPLPLLVYKVAHQDPRFIEKPALCSNNQVSPFQQKKSFQERPSQNRNWQNQDYHAVPPPQRKESRSSENFWKKREQKRELVQLLQKPAVQQTNDSQPRQSSSHQTNGRQSREPSSHQTNWRRDRETSSHHDQIRPTSGQQTDHKQTRPASSQFNERQNRPNTVHQSSEKQARLTTHSKAFQNRPSFSQPTARSEPKSTDMPNKKKEFSKSNENVARKNSKGKELMQLLQKSQPYEPANQKQKPASYDPSAELLSNQLKQMLNIKPVSQELPKDPKKKYVLTADLKWVEMKD